MFSAPSQVITIRFSLRQLRVGLLVAGALLLLLMPSAGYSQSEARFFPETQHTVRGRFLQYWNDHGGLEQQGYPLTEEFQEVSRADGRTYTVQYFERAIFELHPDNKQPYDVLLSQLGKFELDARYPHGSNPAAAGVSAPVAGQPTPTPNASAPKATEQTMSVASCRTAPELQSADTYVCWDSEPGDYIGQGEKTIWTLDNSIVTIGQGGEGPVEINIRDADHWSITFAPPQGKALTPGLYTKLDRYPFHNPVFGGFSAYGGGRGCNTLSARFEILENTLDPLDSAQRSFAANFEQSCEKTMPLLHGEVRYHSKIRP